MYSFTKSGVLVHKETGKKVDTSVLKRRDDLNQINEFIVSHIQKKLENKLNMKKVLIPMNSKEQTDVYMTTDFTSNKERLLVLIPTKGEVSPGQWSKKKCISHSLRVGSMLQAIAKGISENFSLLILNPYKSAPGLETPEKHLLYIWDHFIKKLPTKQVYFWTHGYGCKPLINLLKERKESLNRISGVAFVDPVSFTLNTNEERDFVKKHCKQWDVSDKPLDEKIILPSPKCEVLSGGSQISVKINQVALESIFNFFKIFYGKKEKIEKVMKKEEKKEEKNKEAIFDINVEL